MLDRYLADLGKQLPLAPAARNDILREVRSHLEEAARALQAAGLSKTESEVKAMERFGDAAAIGRELREVHGGTQREAALAACAFALFALLAELPHLLALFWNVHVGSLYTFLAMVSIFLVVSLWAWRGRFPLWSYPWVGFAGVLLLFLGTLRGPGFYLLAFLLALGLGVVFLAATWRWLQVDWRVGSLLFLPAAPILSWLIFDEQPASFQTPFILGIGLLCAATAWAFVRVGSGRGRTAVALAGAAAAVLASFLPVSCYGFPWGRHAVNWSGEAAWMTDLILIIGLLCVATAWAFVRAGSPRRRVAVILAGAVAVVLASVLPLSYYDFLLSRPPLLNWEKTAAWTVGMILGLWALLLSPALLSLARRRQAA